jgi:hypothetical protein
MTEQQAPAEKPDDHDIIYALRTAHQNQTQLNLMADQKANIIVGTIVIFLTFLFTRYRDADISDQRVLLVLGVIVLFELLALLMGILVIRPRAKWATQSHTVETMPNPLFFGFFTAFKQQEFIDYMQQILTDNSAARELLLKDIYQIGQVLKRKYRLLKYAYNFAATGILIAVSALLFELYAQ